MLHKIHKVIFGDANCFFFFLLFPGSECSYKSMAIKEKKNSSFHLFSSLIFFPFFFLFTPPRFCQT